MDAGTGAGGGAYGELLASQRRFFRSGATRPLAFRRDTLQRLRAVIAEREATLLDALRQDLGRPAEEAYTSEVGYVLGEIDFTLRHLAAWMRPHKVFTPLLLFPARSWIASEPYGNTLVIGPWNYPLQLVLLPLVGAVAAGNCVLAKPSELAPATARLVHEIVKATFARQHVAVVEGGAETVQALLAERFDYLFFTGGTQVARIVMAAAARHLTPLTLELGGKNPCIVTDGANLKLAARRIAWGKFMNAGQTCVAPDFVLVHASLRAELVARLAEAIRDFYGDVPRLSPDFGRIVNARHFARLARLLESGQVAAGGGSDAAQRYIAPTVLEDVQWDDPVMQEEVFGPILPVLEFTRLDEVVARLQALPRPLALYVFSDDRATQQRLLDQLPSGGACINDTLGHLVNRRLPFGGVGDSGMGAYHGRASFDTFSHRRSVVRRATWLDPAVKYPPYHTPLPLLRRLMQLLG